MAAAAMTWVAIISRPTSCRAVCVLTSIPLMNGLISRNRRAIWIIPLWTLVICPAGTRISPCDPKAATPTTPWYTETNVPSSPDDVSNGPRTAQTAVGVWSAKLSFSFSLWTLERTRPLLRWVFVSSAWRDVNSRVVSERRLKWWPCSVKMSTSESGPVLIADPSSTFSPGVTVLPLQLAHGALLNVAAHLSTWAGAENAFAAANALKHRMADAINRLFTFSVTPLSRRTGSFANSPWLPRGNLCRTTGNI